VANGPYRTAYGQTVGMDPTFSHFGICVSDLERSLRFYTEGLGFTKAESHGIGTEFAALMDLPDVTVHSQFIRRETTAIELLAFEEPTPIGNRERRPVHQLGLTHLSFRVRDVDATAKMLVALGGALVSTSRTHLDLAGAPLDFVYCTDPDGVRVELMDLGG
jgi:catechol 2,3-dioxygenase-like lactoylglutathione lyase family enzyme